MPAMRMTKNDELSVRQAASRSQSWMVGHCSWALLARRCVLVYSSTYGNVSHVCVCVCAWVCVYNGIYRCKFLCVNGVALCDLYPLLPFKCLRSAFDASSAPSIFVCCRFCCWWQQLAIAPTAGCNVFSSVDYDNCCHSVIHSFAQMTMTIKPTPKSKPKWQQQQCAAGARHMIASTACAHICHTWLAFTAT